MEAIKKWKILSIVLSFLFLSTLVIVFELNSNDNYKTETTIIVNEFELLGLDEPQWNETTRYFEVWNGTTAYIGYTRFFNMEINLLEIVEFKNCKVIELGGRPQYTADNNDTTVIISKEVQRRFLE